MSVILENRERGLRRETAVVPELSRRHNQEAHALYLGLKEAANLFYQSIFSNRQQVENFTKPYNEAVKAFNALRRSLLRGEYPNRSLQEDLAAARSRLNRAESQVRKLPKNKAKETDLNTSTDIGHEDAEQPIKRKRWTPFLITAATAAALVACGPIGVSQETQPVAQATETANQNGTESWIEKTSEVSPISPTEATVQSTNTTAPTETIAPTETPDPALTSEMVKSEISEALAALPADEQEYIKLVVTDEQINSFLSKLEQQGIIGSRDILKIEDNLVVEFSKSGHLVVRIKEYHASDNQVFHDYCITEPIVPNSGENLLYFSLEGARQAAQEHSINPDSIVAVMADENYRGKAVDAQGNALMYVNGINNEDPTKSGQWLPANSEHLRIDKKAELSEETLWQLAEAEAKAAGGLPYIWNEATMTLKYKENGQIIEKVLPISPADVYANRNLETIFSSNWLKETVVMATYQSGDLEFDYQYLPLLYDDQMAKTTDLGIKTKVENNREGGWVVKYKLIVPSKKRDASFGALKNVWVEFNNLSVFYNPINEKPFHINVTSAGNTDRRGDMTAEKLREYTEFSKGDFVIIPALFGDNYHLQGIDGKGEFTTEEKKGLSSTIVPYGKPENAINLDSDDAIRAFIDNPTTDKKVLIPGGLWAVFKDRAN